MGTTPRGVFYEYLSSQKSPLAPFSKRGVGGFLRAIDQRKAFFTQFKKFTAN